MTRIELIPDKKLAAEPPLEKRKRIMTRVSCMAASDLERRRLYTMII